MPESVTLDELDRKLIHALQLDGRMPLARIAAVLGVSERMIARRYQRLRSRLALRVVGVLNSRSIGGLDWFVRIRCSPGSVAGLAAALARRKDTSWIAALVGSSELTCIARVPQNMSEAGSFFDQLHATRGVREIDAQCLLASVGGVGGWPGRMTALTAQVQASLTPEDVPTEDGAEQEVMHLSEEDRRLVAALADDARLSLARLAPVTGWSESTVRRRIAELRNSGALTWQVDIAPSLYARDLEAICWLDVSPAHLEQVTTELGGHDQVAYAAVTTGPTNLLAILECSDADALHGYLSTTIGGLPGINHIHTAMTAHRTKRAGSVLQLA